MPPLSKLSDYGKALGEIGDSVAVVGAVDSLNMGLFHVHVHTDNPRAALPPYGKARQVCIRRLRSSRTEPPTNSTVLTLGVAQM